VPNATPKVYTGAPHGLNETHRDQLNQDLLEFIEGDATADSTREAGRREKSGAV
jgi:hypothetical protein